MINQKTYKVAEHLFEVSMSANSPIWELMSESYGPFQTDLQDASSCPKGPLFRLDVCEKVDISDAELVYSNRNDVEPGYIIISVYKNSQYHYFEFTHPGSNAVNGHLSISSDYKDARLSISGSRYEQWQTFNTGVNFCFLLASANHKTALVHASCVKYKGKAWLFLGKSGTGKSTHSQMWLKALEDVVLMNDDHPVLRVNDTGKVIAYGSPWSGKTRCYKNMEAPVGGIIRISRAPYNKAIRLSIIQSYASLMTSLSGMTWEKELADGRDKTIQAIISSVPCWVMECLPDEDAAKVCSASVTES